MTAEPRSLIDALRRKEIIRLRSALKQIAEGAESNPAHEVAEMARRALA